MRTCFRVHCIGLNQLRGFEGFFGVNNSAIQLFASAIGVGERAFNDGAFTLALRFVARIIRERIGRFIKAI